MNSSIIIAMSVVLLLFIWSWIGLVIFNRLSLDKNIETLSRITNPLPEEERALRQFKDLRAIEQAKVSSAKWLLGFFMLFLFVTICVAPWWQPLYELFGGRLLSQYTTFALAILAFFFLPTYVGLSLAGSNKKDKAEKSDMGAAEGKEA
jgi:hypothetical protein